MSNGSDTVTAGASGQNVGAMTDHAPIAAKSARRSLLDIVRQKTEDDIVFDPPPLRAAIFEVHDFGEAKER